MIHIPCEKCGHDNKFITPTQYTHKHKFKSRQTAHDHINTGKVEAIDIPDIVKLIRIKG